MKGTLEPPSRSSTAVRTCSSRTRSSAAICRRIFCTVLLLEKPGKRASLPHAFGHPIRLSADSCAPSTEENCLQHPKEIFRMRTRTIVLVVAILLVAGFAALNWSEIVRTSPLLFGPVVADAPMGLILLGL